MWKRLSAEQKEVCVGLLAESMAWDMRESVQDVPNWTRQQLLELVADATNERAPNTAMAFDATQRSMRKELREIEGIVVSDVFCSELRNFIAAQFSGDAASADALLRLFPDSLQNAFVAIAPRFVARDGTSDEPLSPIEAKRVMGTALRSAFGKLVNEEKDAAFVAELGRRRSEATRTTKLVSRDRRIKLLCKTHKLHGRWSELAKRANKDREILQLELPAVTRHVARNAVEPVASRRKQRR